MSKNRIFTVIVLVSVLFLTICGCEKDPLDPIQIGRFRPTPVVNIILDSLGVADEEEPKFVKAEEPKPIDLLEIEQDYVLSPGDFITINIFELLEEGIPFEQIFEITESGNISIPEVGQVQAAGLTEIQLEEEIKQILSPTILRNPSVTIRTEASPSRRFTILGEGLPQPGGYQLPGYTYRLADALAQAGSPRQFNVSYIYITRYDNRYRKTATASQFSNAGQKALQDNLNEEPEINLTPVEPSNTGSREELLQIIAPHTSKNKNSGIFITASEISSLKELKALATPDEFDINEDDHITETNTLESNPVEKIARPTRTEWIFKDGKWIAVQVEDESTVVEPEDARQDVASKKPETRMATPEMTDDDQTRVIRIPVKSLGVDPRYNVVIRPGDIITVPFNVVGEAVVMGNVNRPGYIDLTGRPMTLMQAIGGAAGGLSELAEPSRVEVRRRIGEDREQIVMVDLDKIARGLQPDFFIKENDTINVGTLPSSRFAAVLRNAFRATYGFGFVYDRNFSDRDLGTRKPIPNIF